MRACASALGAERLRRRSTRPPPGSSQRCEIEAIRHSAQLGRNTPHREIGERPDLGRKKSPVRIQHAEGRGFGRVIEQHGSQPAFPKMIGDLPARIHYDSAPHQRSFGHHRHSDRGILGQKIDQMVRQTELNIDLRMGLVERGHKRAENAPP